MSTLKAREAGLASTFADESIARTLKVWAPSVSAASVLGEEQALIAPPSTEHWKVPASSEEKVNVGVESAVAPEGPESIWVSGGEKSPVFQSSYQFVPSSASKKRSPLKTKSPFGVLSGLLSPLPGLMSATMTVPAALPSLFQSSVPWTASLAVK